MFGLASKLSIGPGHSSLPDPAKNLINIKFILSFVGFLNKAMSVALQLQQ